MWDERLGVNCAAIGIAAAIPYRANGPWRIIAESPDRSARAPVLP